jgi:hypothetical protein
MGKAAPQEGHGLFAERDHTDGLRGSGHV